MNKQKKILMKILFTGLVAFMLSDLCAQTNISLAGRITDSSNGTAVANASVAVKGSRTGTVTDNNGNFKITVPKGSVLIISSVNYASRK